MGGKKKGVKTGKHEKWEIIKRSTQKNLQGSSYKKEDKYLNPIVYNDIDQAINWKISRPLRVINTRESSQFPLNGGTHQCCFHVIPKRGTVDELRRCRLLNKLVGVDMNFYRSVQPEGITAKSIKFYFDQGNIPREFMFGRQFFCWHHLNLMFGTRPRFIDKDTDKTLGLFAVSNIPKGTLVAAFSNSKINGIPDLNYFRDLANYCTESGSANAEIKTIQISQKGDKNTLSANYCVSYVPVDDDDEYKDHGDYFDKSIYSALELTEDLTANLEFPTQIFVKNLKNFKKNENDFTLSYSKNNFILKVFDESDNSAKIEDQSIRINRGKIFLEESVDAKAIANIIKKHGENLVFLYFCPKTMQCLSDQDIDNCLSIENEPNQEILFFLNACAAKNKKSCLKTLVSIHDELLNQIDGSGSSDDDESGSDNDDGAGSGSGDGTDVDSQNFEANYFDGNFSAEYFDAMTPREYEYLRYIQSQGSQNTSAQISKILPTRSYMDGDERVRLNEPNRAIAYFKLFQLYRKNIDFKNELANRLDQYHEKVTEQVKKITYTPKEEYTEEDIKNLIDKLNADPNEYFNEIVDQQYRNEKDIKKPNFLYQQTLALPMLRGVGTSGSSSGRSEVGSVRSSRGRSSSHCVDEDQVIGYLKWEDNSCWIDTALTLMFNIETNLKINTNIEVVYNDKNKKEDLDVTDQINETKNFFKSNEKKFVKELGWNTKIFKKIFGENANGKIYKKDSYNDSNEFMQKFIENSLYQLSQLTKSDDSNFYKFDNTKKINKNDIFVNADLNSKKQNYNLNLNLYINNDNKNYYLQSFTEYINDNHYWCNFKYANQWYISNDMSKCIKKLSNIKSSNTYTTNNIIRTLRFVEETKLSEIMEKQKLALDERKKTITTAAALSTIETGEIKKAEYFKNLTPEKSPAIYGNYYENGNVNTQTFKQLAEIFSKKSDNVLFIYNNDDASIKQFLDDQHNNDINCLPIFVSVDDLKTIVPTTNITVKQSIDNDIKTIENLVNTNKINTIIFSTDKSMQTLGLDSDSSENVKKYIFKKILALAKAPAKPLAPKVKAKAQSTTSKKSTASKASKGQKEKFNFNKNVDLQNLYLNVNTKQYLNNFILKYLHDNSDFDREKNDDLNVLVSDLLYYSEKMPIYNTTANYNSIYNRLYEKEQINIEENRQKNRKINKKNLYKIIAFHGTLFKVMDRILPALKLKYTKKKPTNIENLIRQYDLIIGYSSLEATDKNYKKIYADVREQVKNYLEGNAITKVNDLLPSFQQIMNYISKDSTA